MTRFRALPRKQTGEPTFETLTQRETMERSENITDVPRLNCPGIKMPKCLLSDFEMWFSILDKTLKENRINNHIGNFIYAVTAIDPKVYNEIRDIILNPSKNQFYETLKFELIKRVCS